MNEVFKDFNIDFINHMRSIVSVVMFAGNGG